jgi:hypothetical protein
MKHINKLTKKELIRLPVRRWDKSSRYDSLIIFSEGSRHESGYSVMLIIGVIGGQPVEIASDCSDDISWKLSDGNLMRTDCLFASKSLHFWGDCHFTVGTALSSIDIEVNRRAKSRNKEV